MKNLTKKTIGVLTMSAFVVAPAISHAQLRTNLNDNLVGVVAQLDMNTSLDTTTNIGISNGTSSGNVNSGMNVDINGSANATSSQDNDSVSEDNQGKVDSNNSLKVNSNGIAIVSSSQVDTDADLKVFASNMSATQKTVSKVEIDSNNNGESKVEVVYKHKGRFLGVIPANVKSTTILETSANGEVEVESKKSWYAFLITGVNYKENDIESRIRNNSSIQTNAKANASASAKAQIAEAIIAEINASVDAQASLNR